MAADTSTGEHFEKKVRPLFAAKCQQCHGAKMQMGGVNLASGAGVDGARLYEALQYTGKFKMPPTGKLADEEIAEVKTWVDRGASWPNSAEVRSSKITEADRNLWAFRPVAKPTVPAGKAAHPIDRFLEARFPAPGFQPSPPAGKLTLLRRATLDLTGFPPTLDEIAAFESDKSPQAFAKVVDRLLASPRYGERWGRHWLDVARLADSTGMDEDNLYPHAWRYRDYVIEAFNNDVPYDRFVKEQIAGDLLPASDEKERARNLTATGFLALGPRPLAQQDRLQAVYDVIDEQIDTVSKAFLGLTLACARCHDHKFDPLLTTDYYAMAGIFANTTQFRNHGRPGSIGYMHYAPVDPAEHARYELHKSRMYAKMLEMEDAYAEDFGRDEAPYRNRIGASLEWAWRKIHQNASLPDGADQRHLDAWVKFLSAADEKAKQGYLKNWEAATPETIASVAAAYQQSYEEDAKKWDQSMANWRLRMATEVLQGRNLPERPKPDKEDPSFFAAVRFYKGPMDVPESPRVTYLRQEYEKLKETLPPEPGLISAVAEGPAVEQRVFVRGQLSHPGEVVPRRFPIVLAGEDQKGITKGSGRLELAEWLASADNPLAARVFVNRLWQWHFGEGLMRSPNNWGRTGEKPTHPELLDYMASRFMEEGWSTKKMHRFIMLSAAYQRSAHVSKDVMEKDPENRHWSRFNRQRMSIEQIRDSLLALDGSLDSTMGGTVLVEGKGKRQKADPEEMKRRTVYVPVRRGSIPNLLGIFDFGDATTSSPGRNRTNVAPQALFLLNSQFVVDRSLGLAKRLLEETSLSETQRVERAYLTVLTRRPDANEADEALSYLAAMEQRLAGTADARQSAWQSFCHVLLATSEFLFVD
jgi:cytochrome c553